MKDKIKMVDLFPKTVVLTYKGDKSFKTLIGGIASLIIFFIMIAYAINQMIILVNRDGTSKRTSSQIVDIANNPVVHDIYSKGFQFAVVYTNGTNYPMIDDPTIFQIKATYTYTEGYYNLTKNYSKDEDMELVTCNSSFKVFNDLLIKYGTGYSFLCPKYSNYTLAGNFVSNNYRTITVQLLKCVNGTGIICKSQAEINTKLMYSRFSMIVANSYMDFNDYNTPVKQYADDQFSYLVVPGYSKFNRLYVRKNIASYTDSVLQLGFGDTKDQTFYSIVKTNNDFSNELPSIAPPVPLVG